MARESTASTSEVSYQQVRPARVFFASPNRKTQTILSVERWLLIRENAYVRAQRRGFVGGDPYTDWLNAEKEIDAKGVASDGEEYSTTDLAEAIEQVKHVFSRYGLDDLGVDALLEKHRDGMEKLASRPNLA